MLKLEKHYVESAKYPQHWNETRPQRSAARKGRGGEEEGMWEARNTVTVP